MSGAVGALYEPLLERDLAAIPEAVRAYRAEHSLEDLWLTVTRFALLAYSPSEHARHALLCCLAARGASEEWLTECARYAAEARQPWSEPPILELPAIEEDQRRDLEELRAAVGEGDRARGERWLASRFGLADQLGSDLRCFDELGSDLLSLAREHGDAVLIVRAAIALVPLLGQKGAYATLRVAVWDLIAKREEEPLPERSREELAAAVVESEGAIDAVTALLVASDIGEVPNCVEPYQLARDYGHLLLAHAASFPDDALEAVARNLEHGESYAEWTFA
ncbi:MAG TPA: hypothetical protein VGF48_24040 [Thermoanaerobaculia bacterium]|jgi:hypothetical protein